MVCLHVFDKCFLRPVVTLKMLFWDIKLVIRIFSHNVIFLCSLQDIRKIKKRYVRRVDSLNIQSSIQNIQIR